ncbi:MAG TPA: tRNA 2-thiouridine(34) synthase MnmA [Syntrophales bacterium]|nr:tRNA 2-thiouridine(34) synthase MnmA [Syntrophales bacterium]
MKRNVLVAMSGGVDSSVAALILRDAGYDVTGVTMCLGIVDDGDRSRCCGRDAVDDARRVCEHLRISHHVIDFARDMNEEVIERFVKEYRRGRTPNPCIDCNRYLKFGRLLGLARSMGFDFLATGHYARIEKTGDTYRLLRSKDRTKDQTYFLYPILRADLPSVLFPLWDRTKEEVRTLAREAGLPVAHKTESQDICFVPRKGYRQFIRDLAGPSPPGPIVDTEGRERGRHDGIVSFTVGQRSGLGISSPAPLYVVSVDAKGNRIVVGEKKDLLASALRATDLNLLAESWPERAEAKIRYRKKASSCRMIPEEGGLRIEFDEPQESITPGQAVVLYRGDEVLGGGVIERVIHESR